MKKRLPLEFDETKKRLGVFSNKHGIPAPPAFSPHTLMIIFPRFQIVKFSFLHGFLRNELQICGPTYPGEKIYNVGRRIQPNARFGGFVILRENVMIVVIPFTQGQEFRLKNTRKEIYETSNTRVLDLKYQKHGFSISRSRVFDVS